MVGVLALVLTIFLLWFLGVPILLAVLFGICVAVIAEAVSGRL